jgi:MFS family permease
MQRSSLAEKRLPIRSRQIFLVLLICLAIAAVLFAYSTSNRTRTLYLTYTPWNGSHSDLPAFSGWILSSLTEPEFYTCAEAGIGLMAGALFAQWAHTHKRGWRGFVLACGSGLWPWVASSALLGLICSNLIWGWSLGTTGKWQPTFVPLVSVAPAVVLLFGPGLRVALTGAILGAVLTTPISLRPINDGAGAVLLASEQAIIKHQLKPRTRVVAAAVAGVAPRIMGIAPVPATQKVLGKAGLKLSQIDVIELNEAFAAQALAVTRELGLPDDAAHVNPNGGAIAIGHPLGASGARLTTAAMNQLERIQGRYALCTMCIGVGQGIALILERL